jgi:phosphoglycerate-specific signal transduction histidine kinase
MGEMASSLAHELNQPLSAISNYCMGVAKRLEGHHDPMITKEILPALEKASDQAHRAGTIIQRIRGFVKRSEPQRKASAIKDIINDAVGLVEIEAHRHRLSIHSEIAEDLPDPRAHFSAADLLQVFRAGRAGLSLGLRRLRFAHGGSVQLLR